MLIVLIRLRSYLIWETGTLQRFSGDFRVQKGLLAFSPMLQECTFSVINSLVQAAEELSYLTDRSSPMGGTGRGALNWTSGKTGLQAWLCSHLDNSLHLFILLFSHL